MQGLFPASMPNSLEKSFPKSLFFFDSLKTTSNWKTLQAPEKFSFGLQTSQALPAGLQCVYLGGVAPL